MLFRSTGDDDTFFPSSLVRRSHHTLQAGRRGGGMCGASSLVYGGMEERGWFLFTTWGLSGTLVSITTGSDIPILISARNIITVPFLRFLSLLSLRSSWFLLMNSEIRFRIKDNRDVKTGIAYHSFVRAIPSNHQCLPKSRSTIYMSIQAYFPA